MAGRVAYGGPWTARLAKASATICKVVLSVVDGNFFALGDWLYRLNKVGKEWV